MNTANGNIILEFVAVGNAVKVSAMDMHTLTEVSVVVPKKTPQAEMQHLAIQKLEYVLSKKKP